MWNNKHKAITFSFDDGVTQDKELIKILDAYGLKATFNINSELLGLEGHLNIDGKKINHNKISAENASKIYKGHEIAVHTLTHPNLTNLPDDDVRRQILEDKKNLEALSGYSVIGMAYPCGGINNNDRVAKIVGECGIKYSRTITSTHNFELQNNILRFNPTVHFSDYNKLNELAEKFLALETEEDKIFYIWGHSYEMDIPYISWKQFEQFCKKVSNKADIFYGTNREILLK